MKILRTLSAFLTSLAITCGSSGAIAGVSPQAALKADQSKSVVALSAFLTRCMVAFDSGAVTRTTGLIRSEGEMAEHILGANAGEVWTNVSADYLMVRFTELPVCKIMALGVDRAVMADLVARVFSEADTPFTRKRFALDGQGGFAAVYAASGASSTMVVRIRTTKSESGLGFVTLSVERAPAAPDPILAPPSTNASPTPEISEQ